MNKDIGTLSKTLEIINKYNFHLKKGFGQNFLVDVNILRKIVDSADILPNTMVIEIGPGIGSLTEQLAKKAKKVIAYEIDRSLIPILAETLQGYDNVKIINEDILKANISEMIKKEFKDDTDIAVVANLPYYITTPILMNLLEQKLPIKRFCVMMQKEVAMRLCGGPNTKEYNALSIALQYYTIPKIVLNVPRNVFIPKPNVDSAVLRLDLRDKRAVSVKDEEFFFKVVKSSFRQRRKTIFNNLKQSLKEINPDMIIEALNRANINPSARGEALRIEEFAYLSDILYELRDSDVK